MVNQKSYPGICKMNNKREVWALIPARRGSKGVVNKNILNLGGHPLIAYSIVAAKKCAGIDRVIVSTNSQKYAEIALKYGAEVPFLRPGDISGDEASDLQFFQHTLKYFREKEDRVPEYFAHLRPTTPIRDSRIINKAINRFLSAQYSALRSVHVMSETSYKTFEIENGKLKVLYNGGFDIESTNLPRQSFPVTYNPNGYIDIVRTSMIDKGLIHGNNVNAFITEVTHDVDEQNDFYFLEFILEKNPNIVDTLFDD